MRAGDQGEVGMVAPGNTNGISFNGGQWVTPVAMKLLRAYDGAILGDVRGCGERTSLSMCRSGVNIFIGFDVPDLA